MRIHVNANKANPEQKTDQISIPHRKTWRSRQIRKTPDSAQIFRFFLFFAGKPWLSGWWCPINTSLQSTTAVLSCAFLFQYSFGVYAGMVSRHDFKHPAWKVVEPCACCRGRVVVWKMPAACNLQLQSLDSVSLLRHLLLQQYADTLVDLGHPDRCR